MTFVSFVSFFSKLQDGCYSDCQAMQQIVVVRCATNYLMGNTNNKSENFVGPVITVINVNVKRASFRDYIL